MKAPTSQGPVCYVLISITPYHHARFEAFAALAPVRPVLVELARRDAFQCLEFAADSTAYIRRPVRAGERSAAASRHLRSLLFRCLDEIAPAVVCVNGWSLPGSAETLSWCARRRVPAVVFSDSTAEDAPRRWWKESVKKRLLSVASSVLVAGRRHVEYVRKLGAPPERIFQGYDAVDNAYFEADADAARSARAVLRARFGLPERYFLACCRFEPKKNLSRLIEAYALYRVGAGPQPWSLVIAGDGSARESLESLADHLGVRGAVFFAGARAYAEMPAFYGLASAFIHASTTEQWGLVVNEAAAAGLPLLVSGRCGCAPELVDPGLSGFLFDPYDPSDIARTMTSVASPDFDRGSMGCAARRIARDWSPERFANGLKAAVGKALEDPRQKPDLATVAALYAVLARRFLQA
jgi:glycosyltransferase involved in cell wall biosynthesis